MQVGEQISLYDLGICCGKTSPVPLVQTEATTFEPSSKKLPESLVPEPLFLDLRTDRAGVELGAFWETGFLSLGAYTTLSFGECPSVVVESRLSQILEDRPLPKYSLSAKACQGILNRAQKRGKELPKILEEALKQSAFRNERAVTGGVKESSYSTNGPEHSQPQITKPFSTVVLEGNGQRPSHKGDGYQESDKSYTLNATEVHAVAFSQDAYDKYTPTDVSAPLKHSGGNIGGGSESLVTQ